jgi:carbon storage regulator
VLVLTRRVNESIVIGNEITVTVISVQGHGAHAQVRLGITAPRETAVLRREVFEAVRAENERALHPGEGRAASPAGDAPGLPTSPAPGARPAPSA